MSTFHLKVVTSDRCFFEGEAEKLIVRTETGDVGILARHVPYVAPLGIGGLTIFENGGSRVAAVADGFIDVSPEGTTVLARTCEWADEIDINRARAAAERAKDAMHQKESASENDRAQVKLKRAINRIRIAEDK